VRRFGRAPVYAAACVGYTGMCLGCMFAPTIELLLLFRALQGATGKPFRGTAFTHAGLSRAKATCVTQASRPAG
jgi:MFS family permease